MNVYECEILDVIVASGKAKERHVEKNLLLLRGVGDNAGLEVENANRVALLIDITEFLAISVHISTFPMLALLTGGNNRVATGQSPLGHLDTTALEHGHGLPLIVVLGGVGTLNVRIVDALVGFVQNGDVCLEGGQDQIRLTAGTINIGNVLLTDSDVFLDGGASLVQIDGPFMILGNTEFLDVFEGSLELKSLDDHGGKKKWGWFSLRKRKKKSWFVC